MGYLKEAIDSALAQTYNNLEIIVYNAASTDSTRKLLSHYSDPRLRVINGRTNYGMVKSWNYVQHKARGEYLKFLADDDLLAPDCVKLLVRAALAHPRAALVTCRRQFINEKGALVKSMGFAKTDKVTNGREYAHALLTSLRKNKIGEPTAVLYPAKLAKKAGGYDPAFSQFADFEYWLRLLQYGDLVYLDRPLCSFRLHQTSGTSDAQRDGRFISETFRLINKFYKDPIFVQNFSLTKADRSRVTRVKTLDILKNIKDLALAGNLPRALVYSSRLLRAILQL